MSPALRRLSQALVVGAVFFEPTCVHAQQGLTPATRDSVIKSVLDELDRGYVFPEKAAEMRKAIVAKQGAGTYDALARGPELAVALTRDLQAISHDKHLRVRYNDGSQSPERGAPPPRQERGGAIGKVEVMAGNVGYVELLSFGFQPAEIADAVASAMTRVADTDALILDVRTNGGGSPDAVRLVSSYLFGTKPVHLNSLYFRPADETTHFYTMATVAGKRFGPDKPVYVLTSRRTFSAAEEFAYNLQSLKRATIVGDTTGGGAHPGGMRRLPAGFAVFVPSGRAINPITQTNWEGTGVRPTIAVPSDSALDVALAAARRKRVS